MHTKSQLSPTSDSDASIQSYRSDDETTIVSRALTPVLSVFNTLTSPAALKTYLSTLLFLLVSLTLVSISTVAFLVFYHNYIPALGLERPIYLQYAGLTSSQQAPWAVVDFRGQTGIDDSREVLIHDQPYNVHVELMCPRTEINVGIGNFMVDAQVLGAFDPLIPISKRSSELLNNLTSLLGEKSCSVLAHVRRPSSLKWRGWLTSWVRTLIGLPSHVLGWRDLDTEKMSVALWEGLVFNRGKIPWGMRVELVSGGGDVNECPRPALQVYSAKLVLRAKFHGLRYVVYNYRFISWAVFSTLFYLVSLISVGMVWLGISMVFKSQPAGPVKEPVEKKQIKQEDQSDSDQKGLSYSNLSDTPTQFPTLSGRKRLNYPGEQAPIDTSHPVGEGDGRDGVVADDEDEAHATTTGRFEGDSGIGTSMESEGPGLSRRRSGKSIKRES